MTKIEAIKVLEQEQDYLMGGPSPNIHEYDEALATAIAVLWNAVEREKNDPIPFDDLDQMEGEPVWIVWPDGRIKSHWWIVGSSEWRMMEFDYRKDYGKIWIAYRHKKTEEKE